MARPFALGLTLLFLAGALLPQAGGGAEASFILIDRPGRTLINSYSSGRFERLLLRRSEIVSVAVTRDSIVITSRELVSVGVEASQYKTYAVGFDSGEEKERFFSELRAKLL